MNLKTKIRATAVAAGVGIVGLGLSTTPASAMAPCPAHCSAYEDAPWAGTYYAEANNIFPLGPALYARGDSSQPHIDYYLQGSSAMKKYYPPKKDSITWEGQIIVGQKITKFRICGPNGVGGDDCSAWREPALS
ncbi:hypothetical protein [Streptomyces cadmiisoli]|uniref:hypothetical protein n=1 Tax=Streptomyces cadmiisoli TaxID=2184053 RepID=UPI0013A6CC1F|nr:hypothetical protein [Streptomyces cadmiisoli]